MLDTRFKSGGLKNLASFLHPNQCVHPYDASRFTRGNAQCLSTAHRWTFDCLWFNSVVRNDFEKKT